MSLPSDKNLSALLDERRTFPPSEVFRQHANWNDPAIYDFAANNPEDFWAGEAKSLDWFTPWQRVLEWNAPWAKWFVGGKLNVTYNCVDRHARTARRNKAAIIWEGEPGDTRVLTFAGRRQGRPHRDLHGHGSRAGHRHAGLREDWRGAFGGVRRIFGGGAARAYQRRESKSCHHRRRRMAAWHRGAA
jgi:acetyl-CoA synthetase